LSELECLLATVDLVARTESWLSRLVHVGRAGEKISKYVSCDLLNKYTSNARKIHDRYTKKHDIQELNQ